MSSSLKTRNRSEMLATSDSKDISTHDDIVKKLKRDDDGDQNGSMIELFGVEELAKNFDDLVEEYARQDEKRETVIKRSRETQKASKQAIYGLHRSEFEKASNLLVNAEKVAIEILPIIESEPLLLRHGAFSASMEEYAEAVIFRGWLLENRILTMKEFTLPITSDEYIGGVMDFTGELGRTAILEAAKRNVEQVKRSHNCIDTLMGLFLQFDFRNGSLRKKSDALKYTLKKIESALFDLAMSANRHELRSSDDNEDLVPDDSTRD